MIVYFIYYSVIIGLSLLHKKTGVIPNYEKVGESASKDRRTSVFLLSALLIILFGFRHQSMGVDLGYGVSNGYLGSFDAINRYTWIEVLNLPSFLNYEKGYILLNKLVGSIFPDRQFLLFVCAFIAFTLFGYIVYQKSWLPHLSFIIYLALPVFFINYSGLRQSLAIAITFYSLKYIQSKKLVPFVLLTLLASTFHFTALVFLAAYPVYHWKKKPLSEGLSLILILMVYIFRSLLFSNLSGLLLGRESMPDDNGAFVLFVVFILIYVFSLLFGKQKSVTINGYSNLFYLACLSQAFSGVFELAMRIGYYFMIYLVLLLPEILKGLKTKQNLQYVVLIRSGISIVFIMYGLYAIYNSSWAEAYPYLFFWQ